MGSIHDARDVSSPADSLEREPETRKLLHIRLFEGQCPQRCKVQFLVVQRQTVRKTQRKLDRFTHIRASELGDNSTVRKLYHRVYNRLRLNDYVDFLRRDIEKPFRLDHLETFVHHGS